MRYLILLSLFAVGCGAASRGPTAFVRFVAPGEWTADDARQVETGIRAWRELGFGTATTAGVDLPLCPNNWMHTGAARCAIMVGLRREVGLVQRFGHRGQADRVTDTVTIDANVRGRDLAHVVAHELGHILLNTSRHTTHGVMVSGGWLSVLSAKDRALACETIRRGCK